MARSNTKLKRLRHRWAVQKRRRKQRRKAALKPKAEAASK